MRGFVLAAVIVAPLAGCANLQTTAATATDASCRHVLSPQGEPLSFCETKDSLTIEEKPIDTEGSTEARLIDDPKFLADMMAKLPKPKIASSQRRGGAAQMCINGRPGYITIAASDLIALIHAKADTAKIDDDVTPPALQAEATNYFHR